MSNEEIEYINKHFLHLLPLKLKSKIKYPYLSEIEKVEEKRRLAEIIVNKFGDKVIWNLCPKCQKLARTPQAKQCRFCNYDWHQIN